ncbi:MAG: hypothetical protein ABIH70_04570, partial [Chloroflexota bacterium]
MDKRAFPLPDQHDYEYALGLAYELACEQLANLLGNLEEQCRRSDAQCLTTDSRKAVIVHYLNKPYQITCPDISVSLTGSDEEVPIRDKL